MKGVDVSEAELNHARVFLEHISGVEWAPDDKRHVITREKMIRIVAWYGAIRAGGKEPGELVSKDNPLAGYSTRPLTEGEAK